MPTHRQSPPDPASPRALVGDLVSLLVVVVVFVGLALFEPLSVRVPITARRLLLSGAVGVPLGVGLTYFSTESQRVRAFWADESRRFVALFVGITLGQGLFWLAPGWVVLVVAAAALAALPSRVVVYRRQ